MTEMLRRYTAAGERFIRDPDNPNMAVFGLPDTYYLPDSSELGMYAGLSARRMGSLDHDGSMIHVLGVGDEYIPLIIVETDQFRILEVSRDHLSELIELMEPNTGTNVLVYYGDEDELDDLQMHMDGH